MKKFVLTILGLACFFLLDSNAYAQNLVVNGDFETTTGGSPFPNWGYDFAGDFVADASANAITGISLRINSTNTHYLTSDVITITPGHTYKLTFTARVQDSGGASGTVANTTSTILKALIFDGVNNGALAGFTVTATSNTNTPLTGNYTAPASGDGSSSVRLRFTKVHNIAYLDNVSLVDVATLPITLSSFNGNATNNGVTLNWTTASENNNKNFTVYSSTNGKDFAQIGIVNGAGNSNSVKNYSFIDKNPANGANYYKLSQTDFDGKSEVFTPIAVNFNLINENNTLSVYANHQKTQMNFNWGQAELATISILDLSGRIIFSKSLQLQNGQNSIALNTGSILQSNLNIVRISGASQAVIKKFITTN